MRWIVGATLAFACLGVAYAQDYGAMDSWWKPNEGRFLVPTLDYSTADGGVVRLQKTGGLLNSKNHPFFTALGSNGRACVTCHQPADGMSLSATSAARQWERDGAADVLFAAIDGSNCPSLPQAERASHSLLIEHGLIRVARPWPPRDHAGKAIKPDFKIEIVRDPTTCNTDKVYGLNAPAPHVSVFRRPRQVANFKYVEAMGVTHDPKTGAALPVDPETGKPVSGNLMADRRALSLPAQMREAASVHLQMLDALTPQQIAVIESFERNIFVAQQSDAKGGALDADGARGGTQNLAESAPGGVNGPAAVWNEFEAWEKASDAEKAKLAPEVRAYRESVARGAHTFREKMFLVSDSAGVNAPGKTVRNSCVSCHGMSQTGMDVVSGQIDLGSTNQPFADPAPWLPLFRVTCTGKPHPHLGGVIYTSDPGYALTTGRCADVGKITVQSLRGLSARAPYFANGGAKDIRAVIDFYDRRYKINYTEQEKQDLANLLGAL